MVDIPTLRRMVSELAQAHDASNAQQLALEVGGKRFAWSFMERVNPKKPRQPRLDILAVRCPIEKKEMLIEAAPDRFFDDDHYRGYPAVLVRLDAIEQDELRDLLDEACRLVAPKPGARRR